MAQEGGGANTSVLPVLDPVTDYEKIQRVGEGTFGVVYKARDCHTGEIVALKKVRMDRERDGVPVTSLRELRTLMLCRHPNIVNIRRVVTGSKPDSMFLVLDYCRYDLGQVLDSLRAPFVTSEVKCIMAQVLHALAHLHDRWTVHRDLKLSNLLLTEAGQLKVCDFGLARYFKPFEETYTPRVITLWYRAPEVLLGCDTYTEAVDMWSAGCVLGELLHHEPLFPASNEADMLQRIAGLLGAPNERIWPALPTMPLASRVRWQDQPYNFMKNRLPRASAAAIDLLSKLLVYDPAKRLSARQALSHPFFSEHPVACQPADLAISVVSGMAQAAARGGGGDALGRRQQHPHHAHCDPSDDDEDDGAQQPPRPHCKQQQQQHYGRRRQEVNEHQHDQQRREKRLRDERFGEMFGSRR